jgi:hypothetical protein
MATKPEPPASRQTRVLRITLDLILQYSARTVTPHTNPAPRIPNARPFSNGYLLRRAHPDTQPPERTHPPTHLLTNRAPHHIIPTAFTHLQPTTTRGFHLRNDNNSLLPLPLVLLTTQPPGSRTAPSWASSLRARTRTSSTSSRNRAPPSSPSTCCCGRSAVGSPSTCSAPRQTSQGTVRSSSTFWIAVCPPPLPPSPPLSGRPPH